MSRALFAVLAALLFVAGCKMYDEPPPPESSYDPYHYLNPTYADPVRH